MIDLRNRTHWVALFLLMAPLYACPQSQKETDDLYERALLLLGSKPDSALLLSQKIAEKALGAPRPLAQANLISTYYYWSKMKLDTAKVLGQKALNYYEQSEYQGTLDHGRANQYLGYVHLRAQELQQARIYAQQASSIFQNLDNASQLSNAQNLLGAIEVSLTNYPKALEYYTQAYKTKLYSQDTTLSVVRELSSISDVYSKIGQYSDALNYAHQALRILQKKGEPAELANLLNTVGTTHSASGNADSAIYYYKKSKELSTLLNNKAMIFLADYSIANTLSNAGRFKESISQFRELEKHWKDVSPSLTSIANSLLAKNYLRTNQYDSSVKIAKTLYFQSIKKGSKQLAINSSEVVWQAYRQKKKYDSAFQYLSYHFALKDSVYSQENQRKLSSLYAEMATLERQKEIQILEKEKSLQEAENKNLIIIIAAGSSLFAFIILSSILALRNREKKQRIKTLELTDELERKKRDLHHQALKIIYINNGLAEIEESLKRIKTQEGGGKPQDIQQVINTINMNKSLEKEWENFNEYFGNVHSTFYDQINQQCPDLTTTEKRLASLLRMNLTNREIASILNIEPNSVKMAKYRLKKKLQLDEAADVQEYLQKIN